MFTQCKTTYTDPKDYDGPLLGFGSYGGIAGMATTYILLNNGQIFKGESAPGAEPEMKEVARISKGDAHNLFTQAVSAGAQTVTYNKPGNMSRFIIYNAGNDKNRIVWSDNDEAPTAITALYKDLMNTLATNQK